MDKIDLLIVIHSHQPVGNFEWVYAEAFEKAYLPFVELLEKHPKIRLSLHYTGCLFDWFIAKEPSFMKRLKRLADDGRVEFLTGGYYEPILPLIPEEDRLGQIKLLNDFIETNFGQNPEGIWIAERVWEPSLVRTMSSAGAKYATLDDFHFTLTGFEQEKVHGYYATEDGGKPAFIFPGSQRLRYLLPFKQPYETIDYLRMKASEGASALTYADDGEKFGLWPGTHKWVYQDGWLENFFSELERNSSWIETRTLGGHIKEYPPTGCAYLPCASYKEMMEWSRGYFRNFLIKYAESNSMHKKMLYVSRKFDAIAGSKVYSMQKKKPGISKARISLYKGQCNCAYWHGVFGGLYLNHLRQAVYTNLIQSEDILDGLLHKGEWVEADEVDVDMDGKDDVMLRSDIFNIYIDPSEGATIFELDYKPKALNLTNTLKRAWEPYHEKVRGKVEAGACVGSGGGASSIHDTMGVKEAGLDRYLVYDKFRRVSLMDHFLSEALSVEDFAASNYEEEGDFVTGLYKTTIKRMADKSSRGREISIKAAFSREGVVRGSHLMRLTKGVVISKGSPQIDITYEIENLSDKHYAGRFGIEFSYSLKDSHFNRLGEANGMRNLSINDEWFGIKIDYRLNRDCSLWYFPIETVSESEEGLERTYQELTLLFNWQLSLAPRERWHMTMRKGVSQIS